MKTANLSLSLPVQVVKDITYLSGTMGLSKSALVAQIIEEPLRYMASAVDEAAGDKGAPQTLRRLRGQSVAHVREIYKEAKKALDEMEQPDEQADWTREEGVQ